MSDTLAHNVVAGIYLFEVVIKGVKLRTFYLYRERDETGVSGTGRVAEGVELTNGLCVLHWLTSIASIAIYDNIEDLKKIHGHHGSTRIEWDGS